MNAYIILAKFTTGDAINIQMYFLKVV